MGDNIACSSLLNNNSGTSPVVMFTKAPGAVDQSLITGPYIVFNHVNQWFKAVNSYPQNSYSFFPTTVNGLYYDNDRNCLYACINNPITFASQNYEQFMICSKDNGCTWSNKSDIANTWVNNRGFLSMSYNSTHKSLYFWLV